jgi:type IV pilus assembly protein PilV
MRRRQTRGDIRGFSLVEVMVAVVVICAGLLGIAKLQALSLSNTSTARLRSLAALEAASLAAAMHSNREYWASTPPTTIVVTPNTPAAPTITPTNDGGMSAIATADLGAFPALPQNCVGTNNGVPVCPALNVAAFDLAWWLTSLNSLLPNPGATINCSNAAPAACTIQITWTESAVAMNSSESNAPGAQQFQTPSYTLYVEP